MTAILFAFIGTAIYRPATYSFGRDPRDQSRSRFLPQALLDVLAARGATERPERIILCGTPTSGWEAMAEALERREDNPPGGKPVEPRPMTQAEVDSLALRYGGALGVEVVPQIITFAATEQDQSAFIAMVARHVGDGDIVHFDVTHGLRHLPMLALVAALTVRKLRDATIAGVWYGGLEMTGKAEGEKITGSIDHTPVVRLDGLLSIADWLSAVSVFEATGSISAFIAPLRAEGETKLAMTLNEAAFRERVQRTETARGAALLVLQTLGRVRSGIAAVTGQAIEKSLAWARADAGSDAVFAHALRFVDRGNELRAVTLAYEAALEKLASAGCISAGLDGFPELIAATCRDVRKGRHSRDAAGFALAYLELKDIRNELVHSKPRKSAASTFLGSPATLKQKIGQLVQELRKPIPAELAKAIRDAHLVKTDTPRR